MDATTPTVLNLHVFEELCLTSGLKTDTQRATALGVHQSTISRVKRGLQRPGWRFGEGCRRAFGLEGYGRLFPTEES